MKLNFTKMHGCGNDYIYIDCFNQTVADPAALSIRLSKPHFGIGADGIILIEPSERADAAMRIFNQDGSEGKMCGNGIRCVGKYLYDSGRVPKEALTVDTKSGVKTLHLTVENHKVSQVRVDMGPAELSAKKIPVEIQSEQVVDYPVVIDGISRRITCVSMGNPHCVVFCPDPDSIELEKTGPVFENSPLFPEQTNTEFVRVIDDHTLQMRVWERGSGETLACGTGACASAVAAVLNGYCKKGEDILVHLRGGALTIRYTDETVWMTGPAETVFTGEVDV